MSVSSDASASYRGYRLQTLYTLRRMLDVSDNENLIFQPEGKEDLAVYDTDHNRVSVKMADAFEASQKAAVDLINIFEKVSETEYDHRPQSNGSHASLK